MDRPRVARAIEAWQPLSPVPLTEADGEEIIEHVLGYFEVLRRWKDAAEHRGATHEVEAGPTLPRQRRKRGT